MPAKTAIDIDGSEAVTTALLELLNRFPGLKPGERILFSTVPEDGGIGFFPTSGAVYLLNKEDITGVMYEPWHFRYVGTEVAEYMTENDLCLEEFVLLL